MIGRMFIGPGNFISKLHLRTALKTARTAPRAVRIGAYSQLNGYSSARARRQEEIPEHHGRDHGRSHGVTVSLTVSASRILQFMAPL